MMPSLRRFEHFRDTANEDASHEGIWEPRLNGPLTIFPAS